MDVKSAKQPTIQPASATKRTAESRSPQVRENIPNTAETRHAMEARPKPVLNTQGQLTGRHLNVSA